MSIESVSESNINLHDPDVRLMLAVQQDDAAAFEELVLRYQGRVFSLLRHVVNDRDLAEDLTQDVFLRVFRARKTYQPDAKFSTWLFTIANNVGLNAIRAKIRKPEVQLGISYKNASRSDPLIFAEDAIVASSGTIPTRRLEKLEMRQMVQLAINELGDRQRMALLLHKFEGLSYIEISKIMDMTPQALKSLLSRARLNLRDILQAYMKHGDKVKENKNTSPEK
ncbi:MAG: sigma-70 family RNA polymerase sigma factor [Planctomycetaceae bacterium]|jgi:RNA polymerase sigma-70 factor (ECF subfamily)|nr:sigma-70 family RNA polymerase sigma factor [Planctomycetaceae bacterium]